MWGNPNKLKKKTRNAIKAQNRMQDKNLKKDLKEL